MKGRGLVIAGAVFATISLSAKARAQPAGTAPDLRIERLEYWAQTVLEHQPGRSDSRIVTIASWSNRDLTTLGIDAAALVQAMRQPSRLLFSSRLGDGRVQPIRYTATQSRRLRQMACVLAGLFTQPECNVIRPAGDPDPALLYLAELAQLAKRQGDGNFLLRRGALLHTDIAMLGLAAAGEPLSQMTPVGSQSIRVTIADGRETDLLQASSHWDIARMLLDEVMPAGSSKAAPGTDDMVRRWYLATMTWMQRENHLDTAHVDRARALFGGDAGIMFLTGSLHETYASPQIQAAMRSVVLPTGIRIAIDPERSELRDAERYFRRAVDLNPNLAEAHLRLGRVLVLTGRPREAADHLRQALSLIGMAADGARLLQYFGELFLGHAEEALDHHDAARASYARAAALYPLAQSPWFALSALERRSGNRDGALREIQRVFDLPARKGVDSDPWWTYHEAQGRDAEAMLEELWRPFLSDGKQ